MKVRFTSAAERELALAVEYYEGAQQGLGAKFVGETEAAVNLIASHPFAWTPMSARTRRCRIHRFPYGLFYQIRTEEILVVSVMDLRRDPKGWEQYL